LVRSVIVLALAFVLGGSSPECSEREGRGIYCCIYEYRQCPHELDQICDEELWTEWEADQVDFNVDDHNGSEGSLVCRYLTKDRPECEGTNCVDLEYRSVHLEEGYCSL
jgi:hypothetical protein